MGDHLETNRPYLLDDLAAMVIQLSARGTADSDNWFSRLTDFATAVVTTY